MGNPQSSLFDRIAASIEPDSNCAMLLLEEFSLQVNWEKALELLQLLTLGTVDYELINPDYPAVVIFRLKPEYMPEAVLKLTEKGYNRLKAINARMK